MRYSTIIASLVSLVIISGCAVMDTLQTPQVQEQPVPEYAKPESEYIVPDFNVLASEFRNEYFGKYVVIDGVFQGTYDGGTIEANGRPVHIQGMKTLLMAKDTTYQKRINVLWPDSHKDDGRPLVSLNVGDKIRVYAFVMTATQRPTLRDGSRYVEGLGGDAIWLIRAVPLEKK